MTNSQPESQSVRRVIVDCDTGVDDALALLYLTSRPEVELVAIGTVHGNVDPATAARNTLQILELVGAICPVAIGACRPLAQQLAPFESAHGAGGLGGCELGEPVAIPELISAAEQLVALVRAEPGMLTLLATGPLTNVALALLIEPELPVLIPELVVMGGALRAPGNLGPFCEANIAHDPEAAELVLGSGWRTTLVSLDTTMVTFIEPADLEALAASASPVARVCLDLLADYLDYYEPLLGARKCPMHDALAAVLLLAPELATFEDVEVIVDTSDGPARGATLVDRRLVDRRLSPRPRRSVRHAVTVERDEAVARVMRAMYR